MQPQSLNSDYPDNWNLLKLIYYIKTFYPCFDPDNSLLEQGLILTTDKSLIFALYLKKLLASLSEVELATTDIEFNGPVVSFALTSVPGEFVYGLIDENISDISREVEDCGYWDDMDELNESLCFYVSLYDDICPGTYNLMTNVFEKELFVIHESYIYVQYLKDVEVTLFISVGVDNLVPDSLKYMVPIEEFIRFKQ